jgi:predicted AlkP superfamily pyrophosphatase or phosphodiesterase
MRVAVLNIVGLCPAVFARRKSPQLEAFARSKGGIRTLVAELPAVTCTVQASMLTGRRPCDHGIVANGWFDRTLQEVHFWKQSNHLVQSPKVWETLRARAQERGAPAPTVANAFWWFNMYSGVDVAATPRPQYRADGRKVPDCWTHPAALRDDLQAKLGPFPLFHFWGPLADIRSTDWIACAAMEIERQHQPALQLVYLPHLDYCMQRLGPDDPGVDAEIREIDRVFTGLRRFFEERGVEVVVLSEYGIAPVDDAVCPNRLLREAGMLALREEDGREYLDPGASRAFAVCDHQVAHVYIRDPADIAPVQALLARAPGVEQVLDAAAQRARHLHHARSGELLAVAAPRRWFAYPWWLDDARAPDYARTVDIHRKPGYDPLELLIDPAMRLPKVQLAARLAARKAGLRTLLETVPLDPRLARGSHGRIETGSPHSPVLIADGAWMPENDAPHCTAVHDLLVRMVEDAGGSQHAPTMR